MQQWTGDQKYDSRPTHKEKKEKENKHNNKLLTKREISKLLPPRDPFALLHGRLDAPDHHRANAYRKHASELWTVNGHDLARVFTVDVEGGAYCLGL